MTTIFFNPYRFARPSVEYPPVALTGASTTLSAAYGSGTYNVTQSSFFSNNTESGIYKAAWACFDKNDGGSPNIWYNDVSAYTGANGAYTGAISTTAGGTSYLGEWIQILLPNTIVLTSYRITMQSVNNADSPSRFVLLGSTNGSTWTLVDSQGQSTFVSWATVAANTFNVASSPGSFNYYRLIIQNTVGTAGRVQIAEVRLFGY